MLSYVDIMLAQTKVSKKRLKKILQPTVDSAFPNCIAMDNYKYKKSKDDKKLSKITIFCVYQRIIPTKI